MTNITAETVGRNLHIHVEGIDDPFIVHPLPSRAGIQITDTYLESAGGGARTIDVAAAMIMAVDGGRRDETTGRWEPVPDAEQTTYNRIVDELRQAEAEAVLMPAFFWQTVVGMDGVNAYINGGGGMSGTVRATAVLAAHLGYVAKLGVTDV